MIRRILIGLGLLLVGQGAQAACGGADDACEIDGGSYHIELPRADNPPLVVFLHGYGGNGAATMRNRSLVEGLLARGYAVMAPNGSQRIGSNRGLSWNFYPGWEGRDETAFLETAVSDAAVRFGVDDDRVMLGGFSAGGFMVNYLACAAPNTFSAYVPVSGGFWRPHPTECKGPVKMLQTHGWSDNVVPLEGRVLGGGRFVQGDIFAGLEIWRETNGCTDHKPAGFSQNREFMHRWWNCGPDSALEFVLFPGGHQVPKGWADLVGDWVEGRPGS